MHLNHSETCTRALPSSISRAITIVASRQAGFSALTNSARLLLIELLRVADAKDPQKSIRLRTDTLSQNLQYSARTVYRLKSELETEGWITRHQIQSRRLGMQVSDVYLTKRALQQLQLISVIELGRTQSQVDLSEKVPSELKFLLRFGLSAPSIFHLMRLASSNKKKLSDIALVLKERLKKIDKVFGYLRKVILTESQTDWSAKRQQLDSQNAERTRQQTTPAAVDKVCGVKQSEFEAMRKGFYGKAFMNSKRELKITCVDGNFYSESLLRKEPPRRLIDLSRLYELWVTNQLISK